MNVFLLEMGVPHGAVPACNAFSCLPNSNLVAKGLSACCRSFAWGRSTPVKRRPNSSQRPTCIAALPRRCGHPMRSIADEDCCWPMQLRAGDPPTAVAPGALQQLQCRKTAVQLLAGDAPTAVAPVSRTTACAGQQMQNRQRPCGQQLQDRHARERMM